jgi:hypothetical protein
MHAESMRLDPIAIDAALQSLRGYCDSIPPVAAMRFRFDDCDGTLLRMSAPLAANVNDKGSAFGGSMASLMTFAGWGLVMLRLQLAGLQADVFVATARCATASRCTWICVPRRGRPRASRGNRSCGP